MWVTDLAPWFMEGVSNLFYMGKFLDPKVFLQRGKQCERHCQSPSKVLADFKGIGYCVLVGILF